MILHADFGATEDHPIVDKKVRKILDSTNGTESDLAQICRLDYCYGKISPLIKISDPTNDTRQGYP